MVPDWIIELVLLLSNARAARLRRGETQRMPSLLQLLVDGRDVLRALGDLPEHGE
jgi:hypothetical protein